MNTSLHPSEPRRLLLNADEAAHLLGISRRHLHKLNVTGRVPRPIRLGRVIRWPADELKRVLDARARARGCWQTRRQS